MRKPKGLALVVALSTVILVLVFSVGASGQVSPERSDVAVGLDTSYFSGTWTCDGENDGIDYVDGLEQMPRHTTCTTESTDPRVVGTEELDLIIYGTRKAEGAPWSAASVLTTAEGTWRGSGHGMTTSDGASGLGLTGFPFGFGEMTYVGEGAYKGLVMRYYLAGHEGNQAVAGWVAPAE